MADEKILTGIRQAEEKAGKIVEKAGKDREEAIKKAASDAGALENREAEKCRSELEKDRQKFMKEILGKKQSMADAAEREAQKIRKAGSNIGRAVSHVSKEFEAMIKEGL